jgi:hypothetical protein
LFIAAMLVAGCHPEPPPEHLATVDLTDVHAEVRELVRRQSLIHTVSGSGQLNLTGPDGQGVVLDLAVVLAPPDRARVRAWKFGQAVFDLTLRPDGAWLEASDKAGRAAAAGATAADVTRGLSLLTGGFFNDPTTVGRDVDGELVLRRSKPGEPTVVCHVERATLVPRRFELLDEAASVRFTLTMESYQPAPGGALWPRRVVADSGSKGKAVVTLDDADVNGDVPAGAFDPPARAERLK